MYQHQKEGGSPPCDDFVGFFISSRAIFQDCVVVVQVSDPVELWDVSVELFCLWVIVDHESFDGIPYLWDFVQFAVCLRIFSAGFFVEIGEADFFSVCFAKVLQ